MGYILIQFSAIPDYILTQGIVRGTITFDVEGKTVVKPEDVMQLESMVREAAAEITRAAKINKQMVQYINAAIEDRSHGMDGYERVVDDYSQLEALAEMSAQKLVRNLEKFNKRVNGKGFLNVVMCKFKKAKAQENANENQGPSVE